MNVRTSESTCTQEQADTDIDRPSSRASGFVRFLLLLHLLVLATLLVLHDIMFLNDAAYEKHNILYYIGTINCEVRKRTFECIGVPEQASTAIDRPIHCGAQH